MESVRVHAQKIVLNLHGALCIGDACKISKDVISHRSC